MKKRRLDQLRHHLVPLYNFDPGEGDDWEAEVLEPSSDQKLQKRPHVSENWKSAMSQCFYSSRLVTQCSMVKFWVRMVTLKTSDFMVPSDLLVIQVYETI